MHFLLGVFLQSVLIVVFDEKVFFSNENGRNDQNREKAGVKSSRRDYAWELATIL